MGDDLMGMLSGLTDPDEKDSTGQEERGLGSLLGGLMGGGGAESAGSGDLLGSLLGGLMGGGTAGSGQSAGSGSGEMVDLLGSLMGGAAGSGQSAGSGSGDMGDLLGSLMGGAAGSGQSSAAGSGGMGDLLGGLLGGGSAGGLGGLLGGLLGGSGGAGSFGGGGGPMLPFAETLAEKLHISPQMANSLIMGAIGLLTASAAKKQSGRSVDLAGVTSPDYIRSSGVASRLSAQMGISEDDAVAGLQEAMGLMAAQSGMAPAPKPAAAKNKKAKKAGDATAAAPAAKKSTRKTTKTTPKKSSKSETGPDFMGLLDDPQ